MKLVGCLLLMEQCVSDRTHDKYLAGWRSPGKRTRGGESSGAMESAYEREAFEEIITVNLLRKQFETTAQSSCVLAFSKLVACEGQQFRHCNKSGHVLERTRTEIGERAAIGRIADGTILAVVTKRLLAVAPSVDRTSTADRLACKAVVIQRIKSASKAGVHSGVPPLTTVTEAPAA